MSTVCIINSIILLCTSSTLPLQHIDQPLDRLDGGEDIEGWWKSIFCFKVTQPELGASKLPFSAIRKFLKS